MKSTKNSVRSAYSVTTPLSAPLLLLMASHVCCECVSSRIERELHTQSCPLHNAHFYNITLVKDVPSITTCGTLCLMDQSCNSFILRQNASDSFHCQLSSHQVTDCSELKYVYGTKTYVPMATGDSLCTKPWRMAVKTEPGTVVKGSLADLRGAVLAGASVSVLWEPFPLSGDDYLYSGELYALDTIQVSEAGDLVTGYAYTYYVDMSVDPVWALVTLDTAGSAKMAFSNSSVKTSDATVTWMVLDVETSCYQRQTLSHLGAVSVPAFSSTPDLQQEGKLSDLLFVLQAGSTMRVVSSLGTSGALAYQTPTLTVHDKDSSLEIMATWIPGNLGSTLPLRVHKFNFSRSDIEQYGQFHTDTKIFDSDFQTDPDLTKTQVFLDPCWELKLSIDNNAEILSGSHKQLVAAVRSGARLLVKLNNGSAQTILEAEEIQLYNDDTAEVLAKMGVPSDNGVVWKKVHVDVYSGTWFIGDVLVNSGQMELYTDKRDRPYRLTIDKGSVIEGSWSEVRLRVHSGQLPRVRVTVMDSYFVYMDVECVKFGYQPWHTLLMSYRQPTEDGFIVYTIGLDGFLRADMGLYRTPANGAIPDWTEIHSVTLFFEDWC